MTEWPPGIVLMVGAIVLPLLRGRLQTFAFLALPLLSAAHLASLSVPMEVHLDVFGYDLVPVRVDRLSMVWGIVFHIAAFLCALYAGHVRDSLQRSAALAYAGSAIAAVFAGDLITLFIFWEITAVSSVFLIWARTSERAYGAGMRYLIIQVGSGVLLLSGAGFYFRATGSLAFVSMTDLGLMAPGPFLIFLAFGIKCAFPLLHNWLQDSYPEATVTGTVFLSGFTTKLAVYALARGFAGTEALVYIGATMTAFPVFYAVIENDLRRVLAYSLNNQLGFMVVGIGIGTELALNGTAAHAFSHVLYKALLFMSMGAVLHRTGTINGSELGGLYKSMPWTTGFCIIGAASISAFPLFSGFVSKSMILAAAAENHYVGVWLVLLFASAGVFHYCGMKIPYFAFFAHDSERRVKEAPPNMLAAMGLTAALCIGIGIVPEPLYAMLPFPVAYDPYTLSHVVTQLQLLVSSALAFAVLVRSGVYPPQMRAINLDTDWVYRRPLPRLATAAYGTTQRLNMFVGARLAAAGDVLLRAIESVHGPRGILARTWTTGGMVIWAAVLLGLYLFLYYFRD